VGSIWFPERKTHMKITVTVPNTGQPQLAAQETAEAVAAQVHRQPFRCELIADRPHGWVVSLASAEPARERLRVRAVRRILSPFVAFYQECRVRLTWK